jgi:hypothetical protein
VQVGVLLQLLRPTFLVKTKTKRDEPKTGYGCGGKQQRISLWAKLQQILITHVRKKEQDFAASEKEQQRRQQSTTENCPSSPR